MAIECGDRFRVDGGEPEADVAVGTDQDHAARSNASADGIDIGIVRDLHAFVPPAAQSCKPLGVRDGPKNKHAVESPAETRPVRVTLPGMRFRHVGPDLARDP